MWLWRENTDRIFWCCIGFGESWTPWINLSTFLGCWLFFRVLIRFHIFHGNRSLQIFLGESMVIFLFLFRPNFYWLCFFLYILHLSNPNGKGNPTTIAEVVLETTIDTQTKTKQSKSAIPNTFFELLPSNSNSMGRTDHNLQNCCFEMWPGISRPPESNSLISSGPTVAVAPCYICLQVMRTFQSEFHQVTCQECFFTASLGQRLASFAQGWNLTIPVSIVHCSHLPRYGNLAYPKRGELIPFPSSNPSHSSWKFFKTKDSGV